MTAVNLKLQLLKNVAIASKPAPVIQSGTTIILPTDYHIATDETITLSSELPAGSKIKFTKPAGLTITLVTEGTDVFQYEDAVDTMLVHDIQKELTVYKDVSGVWTIFI